MGEINSRSVSLLIRKNQVRTEYSNGVPIYIGEAPTGKATSDDAWTINKLTYTSGLETLCQIALGAWDSRASLTYA